MALPKIQHALFDIELQSNKKKIKCRPMLVREEKILLMAKQADDRADQLNAIKQVVTNCVQEKDFNVDSLPFFDLEWTFLKIREQSVSNVSKVSYRDNEDDKVYNFDVDLTKVTLKKDEDSSPVIQLSDGISMVLKYPSVKLFTSKDFYKLKEEEIFENVLMQSIDKIYQDDKAFSTETSSAQELKEFVESIPSKHYEQIQKFFSSIPTLYYKIEYKNSMGTAREIELTTLDDFFTFG